MKKWYYGFVVLIFGIAMLAGCGGEEPMPVADDTQSVEAYTSAVLDTSYEGALNVSSQLALGTLELEGTDDPVTPEQAAALLPLWQALQGSVTAQAEVSAVLAQIEGTMTQTQLQAIAAMRLTFQYMGAWAEESGLPMSFPGGGQGTSDEQRQAVRATMEAGGGPPGGLGGGQGGGQGMSQEEREAFRATMEASGGTPAGGRAGAGGRGATNFLIEPLVELLTRRAAE